MTTGKGKKKCNILKQIRKHIAEANGIPYEVVECTNTDDCIGTCPKCEAEIGYLEKQLKMIEDSGKQIKFNQEDKLLFSDLMKD